MTAIVILLVLVLAPPIPTPFPYTTLFRSLPRTPGNNVYVGFMVWSNFTATKCRGLVRPNHERSEERFSRNAETELVCRLLLEKKKIEKRLELSPTGGTVNEVTVMLPHAPS